MGLHALFRYLLVLWKALLALFVKRKPEEQTKPEEQQLEIIVASPMVDCVDGISPSSPVSIATSESSASSTWHADKEQFLRNPVMARTRSLSRREKRTKKEPKHTRTGAQSDIPPPRICVQDWSSASFSISDLTRESRTDFDAWRPDLLPSSCYASSSGTSTASKEPKTEQEQDHDRGNPSPSSAQSTSLSSAVSEAQTERTVPTRSFVVHRDAESNSETSSTEVSNRAQDVQGRVRSHIPIPAVPPSEVHQSPDKTFPFRTPAPFTDQGSESFTSTESESCYSHLSPQFSSPPPPTLSENFPIFFSDQTSSYPSHPLSAVSGLLYDAPISSAHASILGHTSSVPLPLFSSDSPIKRYRETIARKKSQTQCSTIGSMESISACTSFGFDSDVNTNTTTDYTTGGVRYSRMPYPDLFDFGMYEAFSCESVVGLASFGSFEGFEGILHFSAAHSRLSIPGAPLETVVEESEGSMDSRVDEGEAADTSDVSVNSKRHGAILGPGDIANISLTPPPPSPPPPSPLPGKDVYRNAAYSRPVGMKKMGFVGVGVLENMNMKDSDGMRKAVLRGAVRNNLNAAVRARSWTLPSNGSLEGLGGISSSSSLRSGKGGLSNESIDQMSSSGDSQTHSAIVERLRDGSWDKQVFSWNENEFLEMLRHSP